MSTDGSNQGVTGAGYQAVPAGHRSTYVIGSLDMLYVASHYLTPEHKLRFDAIIQYISDYTGDALRDKFDAFVGTRSDIREKGAANLLLLALNDWCEYDKKSPLDHL